MTPPPAALIGAPPRTTARRPVGARRPGGHLRRPRSLALPRPTLAGARALLVERLFRGRAWIPVLGLMLLGLVFLQVSLLQLNTHISSDITNAAALERSNAEVRATASLLVAGQRIEDVGRRTGMILPGAGAVCYLARGGTKPCAARVSGATAEQIVASNPVADAAQPPAGLATTAGAAPSAPAAQNAAAPAVAVTPASTAPASAATPPVAAQQPAAGGTISASAPQPAPAAAQQPALPAGANAAPVPAQQQLPAQPAAAAATGGQVAPAR